ncbi:hypothetical protein CKM354_000635700 [Cercospora kikuchii]|uniref:F-box domain-containing protein n=1 Tax=Cercospora kikuchii TaxID=84275 RepID=A0A9P3CKL7_9PEZI|nr:uncharacterized protein CKM354_000635700 [Cercospora kikuchii]GIZ43117.1 hypothetical protein CKM354_000635700 [Cercospora kikuchii]
MRSRKVLSRPIRREVNVDTYEAQPDCRFLQLPAELRTTIYELALTSESGSLTIDFSNPPPKLSGSKLLSDVIKASALTRTCKQIRQEARGMLQNLNTLRFYLPLWPQNGSVTRLDGPTMHHLEEALITKRSSATSQSSPSWKAMEVDLGRLPILRFEPAFRGWYNGEQALSRLRGTFPGMTLRLEVWNAETNHATVIRMRMTGVEDIASSLEEAKSSGNLPERDFACLKDLMELERIRRVVVGARE